MFDNLSDKMLNTLNKLKGNNKISESNVEEALKEIRLHFLEADVNFKVVKTFIDRVKAKALGAEVLQGINPGQQFTQIMHDELVQVLGGGTTELNLKHKPTVIMLVGLQGVGKTTTSAKLALHLRQKWQKRVGLVPCDVYRPAAIEQLKILGKSNDLPVYPTEPQDKPQEVVKNIKKWATDQMLDVLIVDTAGRLQIDQDLMTELTDLKSILQPEEVLLVSDAMLGQQSVQVAEGFHQKLSLTGLILTKVDGDARGGAALSIREVTGLPIKFIGQGEKVSALEVFHPDRLASRILDMGDVLSLVEKARDVIDAKEAQDSYRKFKKNEFTFDDFLKQIQTLKKMGGFESMLKMLPGMGQISKQLQGMTPPDNEIKKIEAIIRSMTLAERDDHRILNASRRERIAKGSGTEVKDINKLVKQFEESKKMMKMMMGGMGGKGGFKMPF